jgi:hypothetical protein
MILVLLVTRMAVGQTRPDTAVKISWSAFLDGYYAWDFGEPASMDRSFASGSLFTTQPARHNEFNVNLAFVDATLEGSRVRGRIALQVGTSVQSNYAGEPAVGTVSGPGLAQHIQEAYAGAKIGDQLWIDGGVFFSHIGMEGWISRDNPTYTRSLVAEYSPYYSSGVRGVWHASPTVTAQVHFVNGWQNISENNTGKGTGMRLDYAPTTGTTLSYYNFFSNESGNLLRTLNGLGARWTGSHWMLLAEMDLGYQDGQAGSKGSSWLGLVGIARLRFAPTVAIAARVERFDDQNGVVIVTGLPASPFVANGASLGADVSPMPRLLWRTEIRGWHNHSAVFLDGRAQATKASAFAVSSLAMTF